MEGQAATGGRSVTARPGVGGWGEEAEGPRSGSLEWRASLALKVLAGIVVAGIVLATIPGSIPAPELHAVAFNVTSAALAVLYVLVALALDRRRDWAAAAIRPLLIVLLVWGTYSFGAALADGAVRSRSMPLPRAGRCSAPPTASHFQDSEDAAPPSLGSVQR